MFHNSNIVILPVDIYVNTHSLNVYKQSMPRVDENERDSFDHMNSLFCTLVTVKQFLHIVNQHCKILNY